MMGKPLTPAEIARIVHLATTHGLPPSIIAVRMAVTTRTVQLVLARLRLRPPQAGSSPNDPADVCAAVALR